MDFCYGSRDGQLWPILDRIFNLDLSFETSLDAIRQRKEFLIEHRIGICDIVASAERLKVDASDLGMQNIILRDLIEVLQRFPKVTTLLFTGGNSKNGPEYFFRKVLKGYHIDFQIVSDVVPRIHEFLLPNSNRRVRTVSLTAPSGAANRAVGSLLQYKKMKAANPDATTIDFRVAQYRPFFMEGS